MKGVVLISLFMLLALASCVVTPATPDYGVVVAPPLPSVVVLDVDPYYYYSGYVYVYQNNNWRYSKSKGGPWAELPRSHWPKEIRHKGRDDGRGRGWDGDRDRGGRDRDDDHDHDRH